MKNSKEYYDSIADSYGAQSKERLKYLNAIDDLIVEKLKSNSNINYLDIGSGDGRRALKISNSLDVFTTTLLDDSEGMLKLLDDKNVMYEQLSIFDFETNEKFDLITCLWNVIGHFPSKDYRLSFFNKIDKLLSERGILIFDVNNRYNISYYGIENVMRNLMNDQFNSNENGWFPLKSESAETKVYIHNPFDIKEYLNNTPLKLIDTIYVNYETGEIEKTFFEGQLLYIIGRK